MRKFIHFSGAHYAPVFIAILMVVASCSCSEKVRRMIGSDNSAGSLNVDSEPVVEGGGDLNALSDLANKKFRGVHVLDKGYLAVHFVDGEVLFSEDVESENAYTNPTAPASNRVVRYGAPLNVSAALSPSEWTISSPDDTAYKVSGKSPVACYRKSKLNGMAQFDWNMSTNDFNYEHTMEHWIYLKLPSSLQPGKTYKIKMARKIKSDVASWNVHYDIFTSPSEALHVNLVGYHPKSAVLAADLYSWMGDGGQRDYSAFEGNRVFLYNVDTREKKEVGKVKRWRRNAAEAQGYNFVQSDVWNVDFTGQHKSGVYRLAVEGVGASQDFEISDDVWVEPFRVSTLGYFYMRLSQDNLDMKPVPRRPLWIPGQSPKNFRIVVTDMDPWHPDWKKGGGDKWDKPEFFSNYVKPGAPENAIARGGHSDAYDWDRHLGHVINIYDLLLPYILTGGHERVSSDKLGIAESNNGIPDVIDEARNEVDFWLSLRYKNGYSHGVTNPDKRNKTMYQADNTTIAAWANAANAAILAQAFKIAGKRNFVEQYTAAAKEAWNYASAQANQMLDETEDMGSGKVPGRDLRMTAAAFLYDLTGDTEFEEIVKSESMVSDKGSEFLTPTRNQFYATAAYLLTDQEVHFPELHANMRSSVIHQAFMKEVEFSKSRPSRRATDNSQGYFHTAQFVHRTMLAHTVTTDPVKKQQLERALLLEADWGLGRNPANMVQMTTASTSLASFRSVENCYTTGANDGVRGLHPGHTPYMNLDDWFPAMVMGRPSWLTDTCYPSSPKWPRGEMYFNTRYVWAHGEFTPRQTMRGKQALYGYLLGIHR